MNAGKPTPFSPNGNRYHGPADGRSRPAKRAVRKLVGAALATAYKLDIRGLENLPQDGQHVYTANHPGYLDPLVMMKVSDNSDVRFMAAIENFSNPVSAKVNEWSGAFPVDRKSPHDATLAHGENLFNEGASLGIFPEGKPPEDVAKLGPIKPGAALFAVRGQADSVVPMAFHYETAPPRSTESRKKSLAKSALIGMGAAAATVVGGPVGLVAGAALAGATIGSGSGAKIGSSVLKNPNVRTPFKGMIGRVVGGLAGAALGAAGLVALAGAAPVALAVGAVGVAGAAGRYMWNEVSETRDRAVVSIGQRLPVPERGPDERAKVTRLTEDLHRAIGTRLSEVNGVPYDDSAPKLR